MFPIRDHNPSAGTPFVTWALIAINVGIHLWTVGTIRTERELWALYETYAMIPAEISAGRDWWSLATSAFLHGGWLHLIGNMLFLFIFGDNLEEALGHLGFLAFYLLAGVGAGLWQWAAGPLSPIPTIGASGAIAGVMGGYLLMFPRARVDVLVFIVILIRIVPLPAWVMLAAWFVIQVLGGFAADPLTGGVAYWAHAGGFAVGLVLMLPAWLRRGGPAFWRATHGHPPHPDAAYGAPTRSRVPQVRRRR